jgi:Cation transporting ATPase, C-terminus
VVQLAILYLPALQRLFATQALSPFQLALVLVASTVAFGAVELEKWVIRGRSRRSRQIPARWPSCIASGSSRLVSWAEQIRHREVMTVTTTTLEELTTPLPPPGPPTPSLP